MGYDTVRSKRRKFHWPREAEQLVRAQGHQCYSSGRASNREQVISRLIQMSGNPRGLACASFVGSVSPRKEVIGSGRPVNSDT
jgi:hypothetical protein